MTTEPSIHYPDWKAPVDDGAVLIWPEPGQLLADTRENQSRLASAERVLIQNTPLPDLRRAMRAFVGHQDDAQPLLGTGHQTELYHAGVWVKDVLIDQAARKINGQAMHFAVDTDHPKHLNIRWPGASYAVTDDPRIATAAWSGQLAPPTPAHVASIDAAARRDFASLHFEPPLIEYLESLRRLSLESTNLSSMLTNAQHELDWKLGLRHHALTVSPALLSGPYLAFVHHIMSRAAKFATDYNAALEDYRDRERIKTRMRPMPDLFIHSQSTETPFWLDNLNDGTRTRPSVFPIDDGWLLELVSGEEFVFRTDVDADAAAASLKQFLVTANHRLAPRALTLTIFLRLLVVDQFVHGIGGARYDQVSDAIIRSHFGLAPPKFSVTTATLFFPGAVDQPRVCLPCIKRDGHRLQHAVLGERKRELVAQIASLPRKSQAREAAFIELHRARRSAIEQSEEIKRWEQSLRDAELQLQREEVIFDRELFYAVQSRERLGMMIDNYRDAFSG